MATKFIPRTVFPDYRLSLSDFKGHHVKALQRMNQLAPQLDLILELRDSRAPLSTRNVLLESAFKGRKERIILYTKKDLSSVNESLLKEWHKNEEYMFIDCRSSSAAKRILDVATKKFFSMFPRPPLGLRMMIVGMPNVGKSTLVNVLRHVGLDNRESLRKVAKSGNQPGVTRKTSEIIRISREPEILLYDTPGVLLPQVDDIKTMLSLAVIGTVSQSKIDPVIVADYLLYILNLQDPTGKWCKTYMDHPTNDIYEFLRHVGRHTKKLKKVKGKWRNDDVGSAIHFVDQIKRGLLGNYVYDVEAIETKLASGEEIKRKFIEEKDRVESMDTVVTKPKDPPKTYQQRQADSANTIFKL